MADKKITELTALTDPTGTDLAVIVDDPAGTPETKKMALSALLPADGTAGQILVKQSATAYDSAWENNFEIKYGFFPWKTTTRDSVLISANVPTTFPLVTETETYNNVSLSYAGAHDNEFTLPIGTYLIDCRAPCVHSGYNRVMYLEDVTGISATNPTAFQGTVLAVGFSEINACVGIRHVLSVTDPTTPYRLRFTAGSGHYIMKNNWSGWGAVYINGSIVSTMFLGSLLVQKIA